LRFPRTCFSAAFNVLNCLLGVIGQGFSTLTFILKLFAYVLGTLFRAVALQLV